MRTAELKFGFSYDAGGGEHVMQVYLHHVFKDQALVELREDVTGFKPTDPWMKNTIKGTVLWVPLTAVRFTD